MKGKKEPREVLNEAEGKKGQEKPEIKQSKVVAEGKFSEHS